MAETAAQRTEVMTTVLSLALQAVSGRVVILIALFMTFGLFCWSMAQQNWLSLAVAGSFALMVFLPVFYRSSHAKDG